MRLVVIGAAGRMGQAIVRTILDTPGAELAGALDRLGSDLLGQDVGSAAGRDPAGIVVTDDLGVACADADGIVDFSTPATSVAAAALAAERKLVHVIGTTGFSADDLSAIAASGEKATIVQSGNMSLGVNLLAALVRSAAARLDPSWDIEIVEMHHRAKVDAPSGTALLLGQAAAEGREITLHEHSQRGRDGHTGARRQGDIGFASLRGGTVIGDHTVIFAGAGERIELSHRAEDRTLFATGAVRAALWAKDKPPGFYGMADVLGLD